MTNYSTVFIKYDVTLKTDNTRTLKMRTHIHC